MPATANSLSYTQVRARAEMENGKLRLSNQIDVQGFMKVKSNALGYLRKHGYITNGRLYELNIGHWSFIDAQFYTAKLIGVCKSHQPDIEAAANHKEVAKVVWRIRPTRNDEFTSEELAKILQEQYKDAVVTQTYTLNTKTLQQSTTRAWETPNITVAIDSDLIWELFNRTQTSRTETKVGDIVSVVKVFTITVPTDLTPWIGLRGADESTLFPNELERKNIADLIVEVFMPRPKHKLIGQEQFGDPYLIEEAIRKVTKDEWLRFVAEFMEVAAVRKQYGGLTPFLNLMSQILAKLTDLNAKVLHCSMFYYIAEKLVFDIIGDKILNINDDKLDRLRRGTEEFLVEAMTQIEIMVATGGTGNIAEITTKEILTIAVTSGYEGYKKYLESQFDKNVEDINVEEQESLIPKITLGEAEIDPLDRLIGNTEIKFKGNRYDV